MRRLALLIGLLISAGLGLYQWKATANDDDARSILRFSGYEWTVKESLGNVGPGPNKFGADRAWVDARGRLHLSIVKENGRWTCAEVISNRSFGFGEYLFAVEVPELDPNVVFGMFLWDSAARAQNFREVDIEISRWGEHEENAQFAKQPFSRSGNLDRFELPVGPGRLSFEWLPGRLGFRAVEDGKEIHSHVFTKDIVGHGDERVRMNAWLYRSAAPTDGKTVDVVVDNFRFLRMKKGK